MDVIMMIAVLAWWLVVKTAAVYWLLTEKG